MRQLDDDAGSEKQVAESLGAPDHDGDIEFLTKQLRIRKRQPGQRLDKYLRGRFPRISRTLLQRLIKEGDVTVNGRTVKCSYEPNAGDEVVLRVPPPEPTDIVPEDIPIDVIYEDDHMLAINKRTGIICHPARFGQGGTIANAIAHYAGKNLSRGDDPFLVGLCRGQFHDFCAAIHEHRKLQGALADKPLLFQPCNDLGPCHLRSCC